jgi:hypothetical protein
MVEIENLTSSLIELIKSFKCTTPEQLSVEITSRRLVQLSMLKIESFDKLVEL